MTQTDTEAIFTRDEIVSEIDRGARRTLGLSAAEFAQAYRANKIANQTSGIVDLVVLLNLLREDDPLFERR